MRNTILATLFATAACIGAAQEQGSAPVQTLGKGLVTVESKGTDVRSVIHDLFTQSKKSYVLDHGIRYVLYLSLQEVEFEQAFNIILKLAELKYDVESGIYYISMDKSAKQPATPPKAVKSEEIEVKPKGKLPQSVLNKRLTTRLAKTDLRIVFASITQQTGVAFEIDPKIPGYKLDAFLIDTSLGYALDRITQATGLEYKFTENQTIAIAPESGANRVSVSNSVGNTG
jgi:type II secretory pathway component GspD/PulD (secretin)